MGETMLAAIAHQGAQQFELGRLPIPDLYDNEVLMCVKAAGLNSGQTANWRTGTNISDLPRPIGMHMSGEVVAVGRGVTRTRPGDRIKPDPVISCGHCWACISDERIRCANVMLIGWNYKGNTRALFERYKSGMTAQYMRLPETACIRIPDNVSYDVAAHIGTLSVSLSAIRRAKINYGETLVVNGASGGNGSAILKLAPFMGVGRIIAVARKRTALEQAAHLAPGLVEIVALEDLPDDWAETGALTQAIKDLTGGRGADALIDCLPAGVEVTLQSLHSLKRGGKAVLFGGMREDIKLRYIDAFPIANLQIEGMNGHGLADKLLVTRWLEEGRLVADEFVTARFPLERINDGLALIDSGKPYTWMVINP